MPEGDEKERARQDYKESKNKLRQDIRRCNRKRWMEEQTELAFKSTSDPKVAWQRLAELGGYDKRGGGDGPAIIRDEDGNLLTDVKDVGDAWLRRFQRLTADKSQRGREYWQRFIEDLGMPHMDELDGDFTIKELYDAVRKLKHHKAPGEDSTTAEWMKKLLPMDPEENGSYPSTMAQVVWRLLNAIWREGHIPLCWRRTSLVTILKKVIRWKWTTIGEYHCCQCPLRYYSLW